MLILISACYDSDAVLPAPKALKAIEEMDGVKFQVLGQSSRFTRTCCNIKFEIPSAVALLFPIQEENPHMAET